jgi:peptidoglycan/LPS O-acetylase OafA/YrhL
MEQSVHRQSALDGMRGVAALVVFGIHLWIYQLPNSMTLRRDSWATTALFEGRVAFVMFFVLSGYLLYRAFARAALGRGDRVSTRGYLVRRAARVVPAYYTALAGSLLLLTLAGAGAPGRRSVSGGELPLFFVFGQNYSPDTLLRLNAATWTLAVEVAFYLMLPLFGLLAFRLRSARAQVVLLAGLVAAGLGWNLVDYLLGWGPVAGHSPPAFLTYFACGMLVALAVECSRVRGFALSGRQSGLLVVGAAALLVSNGLWHALDRSTNEFAMEVFADLAAAVAFGAIIASIVMGTGAGLRWLAWRPLAWIGTITYGLYLWHIPVIVWARGAGLLPGGALSALVALPIAIALGAASWYLLEQPLMNRAARLRRTVPPSTEARSERSRSRTRGRTGPRPASWSARAAAERRSPAPPSPARRV